MDILREIERLKSDLKITVAAHYYQRDEVISAADFVGDSLELARKSAADPNPYLVFCGVGFMAQSVKILAPHKRVLMPRIACCSMARMIDGAGFDRAIALMNEAGIASGDIMPVTYINSQAEIKARTAKMGGMVCTSANAETIIRAALQSGKKIFFTPDRCLGLNLAKRLGVSAAVLGKDADLASKALIAFDGFCSVHQLFAVSDIEFYRAKYPNILIAVHPECDPSVVDRADFVGSTSQIIKWARSQPIAQPIAVGTEFNLVNRLRETNTFVLSSTKPECPTMNETTLRDLLGVMRSIENETFMNEIDVEEEEREWAKIALDRMLSL
ncbi:MAG: quinolinate synthase NadA [Helicobacteraceae bacterium]|jgi:quinolinate synthase|nr:quinolinate synthase NadA [Helicobacteraceae bacterium]